MSEKIFKHLGENRFKLFLNENSTSQDEFVQSATSLVQYAEKDKNLEAIVYNAVRYRFDKDQNIWVNTNGQSLSRDIVIRDLARVFAVATTITNKKI